MSLGQRIKDRRKSMKLTQKDLANKMGIDHTTISKWESNTYEPDANSLNKLSEILDVSTDFLLGREVTYKLNTEKLIYISNEYDSLIEINKLIKEYGIEQSGFFDIEKWRNMTPEDVEKVKSYFEFIAEEARKRNKDSK